jgi:hypothetical protein
MPFTAQATMTETENADHRRGAGGGGTAKRVSVLIFNDRHHTMGRTVA